MHRRQSKCKKSPDKFAKLVKFMPSAPTEQTLNRNCSPENYRNFELNGKIYSSVWPQTTDLLTLQEQDELTEASWFQAGLPRETSNEILLQQPPGAFLVRQSESNFGCFALSMRIPPANPPRLAHYLIRKTHRGCYMFKGVSKEFSSLKALIIHHSVMPELLPVPLMLSRDHNFQIEHFPRDESESEGEITSPPTTLCFRKKC